LQQNDSRRGFSRVVITALVIMGMVLAWFVVTNKPYRSDSDFGYNLGLIGGVMMLTLLLYPVRKRFRFMSRVGKLSGWFSVHMMLGVLGPVLVLFHSTFKIGAVNSRIAFYVMVMVVISGLVGRFVYRHIHHGLYGSRTTLVEVEQEMKASTENISSVFALAPGIGEKLAGFQSFAFERLSSPKARAWRFMTLHQRGHQVALEAQREAWEMLEQSARAQNWSQSQEELLTHRGQVNAQIDQYVEAVCSAAMFATWERLFSLWHVIHIPFIFLLFLSGVLHVVAVHMY